MTLFVDMVLDFLGLFQANGVWCFLGGMPKGI